MADVPIDCDFPVWGLLPKKETGVVSFLNKYPNYDGRDTVIVIFDSGVDPAAEGLKVTSTGETKVIERFDCSGCGDVDTSNVIKKTVDGAITGLTGRKLKIPPGWKNPTGEWRVGILHPFSLYPTKLKERMQEHRKEHIWDSGHKPALAEATKKLQDYESEIATKTNLTPEEKAYKEELEARVDVLQSADKKYVDVGPTYDCVLFHDGNVWRACIDISETGDLSSGRLLGEFSATQEHAHLTPLDEMTVSINVHDDGDTLEVVGMCSTHGTHVAAIASGYFPNEPERNGVAPGAKIISLTIGDSRLGSMETGTALIRACIKVMELSKKIKIDVINMSYGEHAHWSNTGRVGEVICEVVNRYGVSWVVSAGNHGPALGTVGAPPDIQQPLLIGVGAYVSPEMMSCAYSMRERACGGAFTWSSRGPAADGALGVSVCAPGGALTSVARFTLRNSQLMNGTSMAAPHVAGAVAALISGLKAKNLPYSPYSIKRNLENSSTYLSHVEPWAQGAGLLNIEKAFDSLTSGLDNPERDVTFSIQCGNNNGKGVLLRPKLNDTPKDIGITIEPKFLQSHLDMEGKWVIPRQISFKMQLALSCNAAWVSAPKHLDITNAQRPISIRVDTTSLPPGAHFTSINAYDVSCVEKGPVFRIPITVMQPEPLQQGSSCPNLQRKKVLFKPNTIHRHFIIVPEEASYGRVRLRISNTGDVGHSNGNGNLGGRFLLHAMQLVAKRSCRSHETQKLITVTPDAECVLPFQLQGGVTLEVVIAKYWANLGDVSLDYSIELYGVKASCGTKLVLHAADGVTRLSLQALRHHDLQPSASLKYAEPVVRPSESKISPLTSRDVIPPNKQIYQLVNTYNFHIQKPTEVSPIISPLCDMLYESEFESQMWMLYNVNKQLMAVGDAYPSKYSVKLDKGEYSLRLRVRHDARAVLERLQDVCLTLQQRLPAPLPLDMYCSVQQALTGGKKFSSGTVTNGTMLPLYIAALPSDKLGRSNLTVGQTLTGTITYVKDELARKVDSHPLVYIPVEPPRRNNKEKEKPKPQDDYLDAYKDFMANWLTKLEGEKLESVYNEVLEKCPNWPAAHIAYLQGLDSHTDPKKLPKVGVESELTAAQCEQIINIADMVLKQIDQDKLLAYLGMKNDARSDASKIKQEQDRHRSWVLEALCRRGVALCRSNATPAVLQRNMADLLKYTDVTDAKAIHYGIWHCFSLKHWGRAIKLLNKIQEDRPSLDVEERLVDCYKQLNWQHLAKTSQDSIPIKYPSSYRPF